MAYFKAIDHTCLEPRGGTSRNAGAPLSTADRKDRREAQRRSHIATCKLRRGLSKVKIVQRDDSSWAHMVNGEIIALFACVTEAVAAL